MGSQTKGDNRKPTDIPEQEGIITSKAIPAFGNLVPRDVASRAAKERCDEGYGVGTTKWPFTLILRMPSYGMEKQKPVKQDRIRNNLALVMKLGKEVVEEKYGNLFEMYEKRSPAKIRMKHRCAFIPPCTIPWEAFGLITTCKPPFPVYMHWAEANFSDHGANRLGASALMQGFGRRIFCDPYTLGNYLADEIRTASISTDHPAFVDTEKQVRTGLKS